MDSKLRPYQVEDAAFLTSLPSSACFNEQRTGKTPIALETIKIRGLIDEKVLIITTASSVLQWKNEYQRWLDKPCVNCVGTLKQKQKAIQAWTHGLVISIDSFKETSTTEGMLKSILKQKPQQIILDEAHKIKNPKSANAKALFKTGTIPYKLALTGTPASGKPYDIYSILHFLYPQVFRGFWTFLDNYFIIQDQTVYSNGQRRTFKTYESFQPGKDTELQKTLSQFSTIRKRKDVMQWLPDKFYEQVKLEPSKEQKKYLKDLEETYKVGDITTTGTLDRLVRYRQICNSPTLLGLKGKSPKTEYIIQYIKDHPTEQIIIFSKFTSYLYELSENFTDDIKWALLVGNTPTKQRGVYIKDFQSSLFNVFLINIDAGKEAITLDAAETTIFADKYPPIGDILQAEDRFIASTKEKANKAHKIIELMITGTFDEALYKLLELRKSETDIINNYQNYLKGEKQ